jgi:hypothetical protein
MIRKQTPTMIAIAALVFAMAGGAVAAGGYLITSTNQIKPSVLRSLKGKRGSAGKPGTAGIASIQNVSASAPICGFGVGTCDVASATATCPGGTFATGGDANADTIETSISTYVGPNTYGAIADNASGFSGTLTVDAVCVSGPGIHFAAKDDASARMKAMVTELRLRMASR